ncbi:MFS transporter [Streptomyces sp. NBC_01525]|uniref:MFS transporter n=1 Tax=Streptomyces benahoarensis TaxID=2595054 RepID=A0A553ZNT0_9ACTN|nr:MFS transporter [Streptomyces benahoarensis]TSB31678.1 MFS transporter [Streptomyces benahoarensis]TSB43073.1 MFS transporter [Streptomyces benahoarensis]
MPQHSAPSAPPPPSETTAADPAPPDAAADRYARKAVVASAVGYGLEGFDLLILSFALSAVTAGLHLTSTQAGSLTTLTLIGCVAGGLLFGMLSDRLGRIRVLSWSIVLFAVFTGATALAQDFPQLAAFRFLAGMGIGGEFGIGMALAAEAFPSRKRARGTSYVGLGWQAGVLTAALVSAPVINAWGWRALFALGVVPALAAFLFRRTMREPAAFTASTDRARPATTPLRSLVDTPAARRATLGVLVLTSVQNFGYYGLMTWLPSYLSQQFGYSLTKSGAWTAVTVLGMACGILAFGHLADRIGRRPTFWLFQTGAVLTVLAYATLTTPVALLIGGAVMGAFVNGMTGGYGALIAELYPTHARATAQNVLFNLGRGVGGFAPLVVALVAGSFGFQKAIGLLAVLYVLDMAAMFLIPERKGAALD